ncbi:MAG: NIPSNAP family protein [Chloroflexi bacterium]|nr:NIPSNAP family protein [Chloroflexota bacterium]
MIYEYRVYETLPGMLPALHARFRDHTTKIFERHGIKNIGYWTSEVGDFSDRLIYIVAFEDACQRQRAWASFRKDP